jgi:tripartite-type tricarboxylate transporter receptor subunit TctC
MPDELRDHIAAEIREVAEDPEIRTRLIATGQLVRPGSATDFAVAIDEQAARLAEFTRMLGIKRAQ